MSSSDHCVLPSYFKLHWIVNYLIHTSMISKTLRQTEFVDLLCQSPGTSSGCELMWNSMESIVVFYLPDQFPFRCEQAEHYPLKYSPLFLIFVFLLERYTSSNLPLANVIQRRSHISTYSKYNFYETSHIVKCIIMCACVCMCACDIKYGVLMITNSNENPVQFSPSFRSFIDSIRTFSFVHLVALHSGIKVPVVLRIFR